MSVQTVAHSADCIHGYVGLTVEDLCPDCGRCGDCCQAEGCIE